MKDQEFLSGGGSRGHPESGSGKGGNEPKKTGVNQRESGGQKSSQRVEGE